MFGLCHIVTKRLLWTTEMDFRKKTLILVLLVICVDRVSALKNDLFEKPKAEIVDGEVTIHWKRPAVELPTNSTYNVHFGVYSQSGNWTVVESCSGITQTSCDLNHLINDYSARYKVKVELVAGNVKLLETGIHKFVLTSSTLTPPSFTLSPTSSTLTVLIHQKPALRKLFPYDPIYTIYLEERGQDSQNVSKTVTGGKEDVFTETFSSLKWGREYCVNAKVQGSGAVPVSDLSPKQCVVLPEEEWFIIAVVCLALLAVLTVAAVIAAILLCYLKKPEKTPAVLKSPKTGWRPNSIVEGPVEVVTDKGWFLFSDRPHEKSDVKDPVTPLKATQDEEDVKRTSADSGVSLTSSSTADGGGESPSTRRDSGCGSLGGQESSTSSQTTVYPLQGERTDAHPASKREDSGVELGSSNGQDSGPLKEAVMGGSYRGQSPPAVQSEETPLVLANVVTGYRATSPQSCICQGAGHCMWCHKQGFHGTVGVIRQYRGMCVNDGLLNSSCDFTDPYRGKHVISSYTKKTEMNIDPVADLQTRLIELGETFPLLTALSSLPPVEDGRDFNMNTVPLSLCDVQLTND